MPLSALKTGEKNEAQAKTGWYPGVVRSSPQPRAWPAFSGTPSFGGPGAIPALPRGELRAPASAGGAAPLAPGAPRGHPRSTRSVLSRKLVKVLIEGSEKPVGLPAVVRVLYSSVLELIEFLLLE